MKNEQRLKESPSVCPLSKNDDGVRTCMSLPLFTFIYQSLFLKERAKREEKKNHEQTKHISDMISMDLRKVTIKVRERRKQGRGRDEAKSTRMLTIFLSLFHQPDGILLIRTLNLVHLLPQHHEKECVGLPKEVTYSLDICCSSGR